MLHLTLATLTLFAITTSATAAQSFQSARGKNLVATFYETVDGERVERATATRAVTTIEVCGDSADEITETVLWMPDHGHGSAPTELTRIEGGCSRMTNVHFVMMGRWEIRYSFGDGDRATQTVSIRR